MTANPHRTADREQTLVALVPAVSVTRIALAAAAALRPAVVVRGSGAPDTPAARVLVRAVAGRELVLGAGALWACSTGWRLRPWLVAQGVADALDLVVLVVAVRTGRLPAGRGYALAAFAFSGVVAEAATVRAVGRR